MFETCRRNAVWTGQGMGGLRLDRPEARLRLGEDLDAWAVTELLDVFETGGLASREAAKKRREPEPEED